MKVSEFAAAVRAADEAIDTRQRADANWNLNKSELSVGEQAEVGHWKAHLARVRATFAAIERRLSEYSGEAQFSPDMLGDQLDGCRVAFNTAVQQLGVRLDHVTRRIGDTPKITVASIPGLRTALQEMTALAQTINSLALAAIEIPVQL